MKTNIFKILLFIYAVVLVSCEDILEQDSVDSFSEETIFEDVNLVKAYLGRCYSYLGGDDETMLGLREDLLSSATDETLCIHRPGGYTFVQGKMSPDELGHFGDERFSFLQWDPLYKNIKNVNVLLANIDDVPIETEKDKELLEEMKAEAYFIRAFTYTNLLRSYGGVILIDKPFELGEDFSEIKRSSIDETLDFILSDIENAITGLPMKNDIEQGRATKGAAGALKSRVLNFCTGELMHGGYESSNPLVSFQSKSREEILELTKEAAKDLIEGKFGEYSLTGNTDDPPANMTEEEIESYIENFYSIFVQKGEWNDEVIFGVQYLNAQGNEAFQNRWNGPNGYHNWGNNNPLEPVIREFEMVNGEPFIWDKYDNGNNTTREFSLSELQNDPEKNPYAGREPRFYATVLFDGAKWQNRPEDAEGNDPEGKIQTGYYISSSGKETAGLDTRQSIIESWNGTKVGYYLKKYLDEKVNGQYYANENTWIEMRYAEVLLDFAEAAIELGDIQEGLNALNEVRNRAGLPDRTTNDKDKAREWLRHERQIEFFGEGDRWYSIRKWMIADKVIKDVHPMIINHYEDEKVKWHYDTSVIVDKREWKDRQYWMPISRIEMNKAPQLTQNPGY